MFSIRKQKQPITYDFGRVSFYWESTENGRVKDLVPKGAITLDLHINHRMSVEILRSILVIDGVSTVTMDTSQYFTTLVIGKLFNLELVKMEVMLAITRAMDLPTRPEPVPEKQMKEYVN